MRAEITGLSNISTLLLPATLALNRTALPCLEQFVSKGGRLVADQPFLLFDEAGNTVDHTDTVMSQVFGCYVRSTIHTI